MKNAIKKIIAKVLDLKSSDLDLDITLASQVTLDEETIGEIIEALEEAYEIQIAEQDVLFDELTLGQSIDNIIELYDQR
jgi:acyl carrier protein